MTPAPRYILTCPCGRLTTVNGPAVYVCSCHRLLVFGDDVTLVVSPWVALGLWGKLTA